jgi:signal transduction histidine kinase
MLSDIKKYLKTTRFRNSLWYSLIFFFLEVILGIVIYTYLEQTMIGDLDNSLSRLSEAVYDFVKQEESKLVNFAPDSLHSSQEELVYDLIFEEMTLNLRNTFIQISLNDGIIFKSSNLKDKEILFPLEFVGGKDIYSFNDPAISSQEIRAAYYKQDGYDIVVAFPLDLINKNLKNLIDLYIIILPIFFLISFFGGALLSVGSLSRLDQLIKRTNEITTKNLNAVIEGEDIDDEYGRLIKTLNKLIERFKTSINYMSQFSIDVSHELKTPLTILRGEIEIALRSPKPAEEYKRVLESNYEEILQLTNIIDRLFFLTKLDHKLFKLKIEPISVSDLLATMVSQLEPLAKQKNIKIVYDGDPDIQLLVDIEMFRRAITNLITNAIKYGDANTSITISAGLTARGHTYISVNNKGITIPRELHEKIFERFCRNETSRNIEPGGIGLGLSIAKSIVLIHKGKIWVESEPKKGTTFWISLDLKKHNYN